MAEIWICNPFDNLPAEGAKPQRYASLAEELTRQGHKVTWWSADFSHAKKAKRRAPDGTPLPDTFTMPNGVKVRLIPTIPYKKNISLKRVKSHRAFAMDWYRVAKKAVDSGESKPEFVIISTPPLSTYKIADTFRKEWGCKIVLDIMDAWPKAFERLLPKPLAISKLLTLPLFAPAISAANNAYKGADIITAISSRYLDMARRAGSKAPMASFYHTCQELKPNDHIRNTNDTLRIIYVGNMGAFYALDTVIKAIKGLEQKGLNIRLDLVGSGPDEEKLRALANDSKAIHFHGFLDAKGLDLELSKADIGLIPLRTESAVAVPYKLPDYTAYGLPLLNSLGGECNNLIQKYNAGINYNADSQESLQQAILEIVNDPTKYNKLKSGSLALANTEFLADKIYPAFAKFITSTPITND